MSFLNPVNEPVLRFSSTDAGAPQINYNARTAGDVKAVLKACLVTGYGTTASAGWTTANEVGNVIEFVSPAAAMSDYKLGVDDASATSTTWYYQYQGARVNPELNAPSKVFEGAQLTHNGNGWTLLSTDRGVIFIETTYQDRLLDTTSRVTYFGAIKSGLLDTTKNICFYSVGYNGAINDHHTFFNSNGIHVKLSNLTTFTLLGISPFANGSYTYAVSNGVSAMDITSGLYLQSGNMVVGQLPALLSKVVNNTADLYGLSIKIINGKQYLNVASGYKGGSTLEAQERIRVFLIPLDYWEY